MDLLSNKVEHLERERVELTMQLHKRDEKDRDRKLRLEHLELRLKISEDERGKATSELNEYKDKLSKIKFENENLQEEVNRLTKELQSSNRFEAMDVWKKMTTASRELKRVEEELISVSEEKTALSKELAITRAEMKRVEEDLNLILTEKQSLLTDLAAARNSLIILEESIDIYKQENKSMSKIFEDCKAQFSESEAACQDRIEDLESEINRLKEELEDNKGLIDSNIASKPVTACNDEYEEIINELRQKLTESERVRRKLHNQVQDLRGNIRVYIRCRPFLRSDGDDSYQSKKSLLLLNEEGSSVAIANSQSTVSTNNGVNRSQVLHQFAFDKIFGQDAQQNEIYQEVSTLIQSVLDGYRVCVFSYGQTGSGKTHTMTGDRSGEQRGIIPRAIEELLQESQQLQSSGWEIQLSMSVVELYNEEIRDLLTTSSQNNAMTNGEKFKIFRQNNGRVLVNGLTNSPIATDNYDFGLQQFYDLLEKASQIRSTACTNMNETSSRSHLIVMIDVVGIYSPPSGYGQKIILNGGLRLCDLAGSERLDRTNTLNDATRLKETVNINKSLSCLADVFLALSNKQQHVPYRNSKLTMLLQDCLSGDGKSLMFVNISPTIPSTQETLCSLRFANQVSQVELGKAQKHIVTSTVLPAAAPLPPTVVASSTNHNSLTPVPPSCLLSPKQKVPNSARKTPVTSSRKRSHTALEEDLTSSSAKNVDENDEEAQNMVAKPVLRSATAPEISPKPFRSGGVVSKPLPMYSFLTNQQQISNTSAPKSRLGNPMRKQPTSNTANTTFIANNNGANRVVNIQSKFMGSDLSSLSSSQSGSVVRKKTKFFR